MKVQNASLQFGFVFLFNRYEFCMAFVSLFYVCLLESKVKLDCKLLLGTDVGILSVKALWNISYSDE